MDPKVVDPRVVDPGVVDPKVVESKIPPHTPQNPRANIPMMWLAGFRTPERNEQM
jgi:hypothetical protein